MAHSNLGNAFKGAGDLGDAVAEYRQAIELDPTASAPHANLGFGLKSGGVGRCRHRIPPSHRTRSERWLCPFRTGHRLKGRRRLGWRRRRIPPGPRARPRWDWGAGRTGQGSRPAGPTGGGAAAWGAALERCPRNHDAWYGYAELCLFLGRDEDYRRNCPALLDRFGDTADPSIAERTARACLLLPASGDDLERAAALADRAAAAGPTHQYYNFFLAAKGLADYRRGRFDAAVDALQQAGAGQRGCPLRARTGHGASPLRPHAGGADALAAAVQAYDWDEAKADNQDAWIAHVLRREAEELIVPNLAAFLKGGYQPKDNTERLELAGHCLFRRRSSPRPGCTPTPLPRTRSSPTTRFPATATTPPAVPRGPAAAMARTPRASTRRNAAGGENKRWIGCGPTWKGGRSGLKATIRRS